MICSDATRRPHAVTLRQVYNTGRSLGQFVSLLEEKAGKLALPDVLITAVGTKVALTSTFAVKLQDVHPYRQCREDPSFDREGRLTAQVFMLDCQSRSTANNAGWREDRQWARALDHGWNLGVAKQVCSAGSLLQWRWCACQPVPTSSLVLP